MQGRFGPRRVHRLASVGGTETSVAPVGPEAVARAYLDAFGTGDADVIAGYVAEDFVNEHTAALGAGCRGRDAYRVALGGFLADMVDLGYEVEDLVVDGDRVAAFYNMSAQWQGATPISVRGVQRLVVRDDLIVHRTDYWDSAVFLLQADERAPVALAPFGIS